MCRAVINPIKPNKEDGGVTLLGWMGRPRPRGGEGDSGKSRLFVKQIAN